MKFISLKVNETAVQNLHFYQHYQYQLILLEKQLSQNKPFYKEKRVCAIMNGQNGICIYCAGTYSMTLILLKLTLVPKSGLLVAKRLCLSPNLPKKRQIFTPGILLCYHGIKYWYIYNSLQVICLGLCPQPIISWVLYAHKCLQTGLYPILKIIE